MWRNPKYLDQHQPPQPPAEQGERLAVFPRGTGQELRVALAEYQGRPFLSLRVWAQDPNSGDWWPVKGKGCSVRIAEAAGLAEILSTVVDRARSRQEPRHGEHDARDGKATAPAGQRVSGDRRASGGPPSQATPSRTEDGRPQFVDRRRSPDRPDWREQTPPPRPEAGADEFDELHN